MDKYYDHFEFIYNEMMFTLDIDPADERWANKVSSWMHQLMKQIVNK